jgi:hypothetical protein
MNDTAGEKALGVFLQHMSTKGSRALSKFSLRQQDAASLRSLSRYHRKEVNDLRLMSNLKDVLNEFQAHMNQSTYTRLKFIFHQKRRDKKTLDVEICLSIKKNSIKYFTDAYLYELGSATPLPLDDVTKDILAAFVNPLPVILPTMEGDYNDMGEIILADADELEIILGILRKKGLYDIIIHVQTKAPNTGNDTALAMTMYKEVYDLLQPKKPLIRHHIDSRTDAKYTWTNTSCHRRSRSFEKMWGMIPDSFEDLKKANAARVWASLTKANSLEYLPRTDGSQYSPPSPLRLNLPPLQRQVAAHPKAPIVLPPLQRPVPGTRRPVTATASSSRKNKQ